MDVWEDFADWRDDIYCGGEREREWIEAEIGKEYELYDYIYNRVKKTVVCTEDNKDKIEQSLNDTTNDMWSYRKKVD